MRYLSILLLTTQSGNYIGEFEMRDLNDVQLFMRFAKIYDPHHKTIATMSTTIGLHCSGDEKLLSLTLNNFREQFGVQFIHCGATVKVERKFETFKIRYTTPISFKKVRSLTSRKSGLGISLTAMAEQRIVKSTDKIRIIEYYRRPWINTRFTFTEKCEGKIRYLRSGKEREFTFSYEID